MNTKKITILFYLLLTFISVCCNAQDTFRIAVAVNSNVAHVGGDLIGGSDSLWHRKAAVRMQHFTGKPTKVYQINSIGGRTIGSMDARKITGRIWNFTNYEYDFGLVDSVLKVNPHLVIITAQTNEITNGMPCDTVIDCFKSVIDTLKYYGKQFIFTDGYARQRTFISPITAQTYHDSTVKFNNWLYANHGRNTARIYKRLYDTIFQHRPFPWALGPDSLHTSTLGKDVFWQEILNCPLMDSILAPFRGNAYNLSFKKVGSNLELKVNFKGRRIQISGSNSLSATFVKLRDVFPQNNSVNTISTIFPDDGYIYYKLECISGNRVATKTYQIN